MSRRGLNITLEREVDTVCDRFEALLQAGQQPNVDEFLKNASAETIPALTVELLRLAVEYAGTTPSRKANNYDASVGQDHAAAQATAVPSSPETILASTDDVEGVRQVGEASASTVVCAISTTFGDYELLNVLGSGGMGTVYQRAKRASIVSWRSKSCTPSAGMGYRKVSASGRSNDFCKRPAQLPGTSIPTS